MCRPPDEGCVEEARCYEGRAWGMGKPRPSLEGGLFWNYAEKENLVKRDGFGSIAEEVREMVFQKLQSICANELETFERVKTRTRKGGPPRPSTVRPALFLDQGKSGSGGRHRGPLHRDDGLSGQVGIFDGPLNGSHR